MVGPLCYIGGKNRLAKTIITAIPKHTTYVEVFAGGAQVLFHKQPSAVEVLNDVDCDVVNFFRVLQHHYQEFLRHLEYCLVSRKWYELIATENPAALTDIQRASRYFYLQKNSFGALIVKRHYHYGITQRPNYNPERIPEIIKAAHERLRRVQIESAPYQDVLRRYNRITTFYFLDPPYWNRKLYNYNFREQDFIELERQLHSIKGKFLLTLDDHPEVRKLFATWHIERVELSYTAQRSAGKRYRELFITNYELADTDLTGGPVKPRVVSENPQP